MHNQQEVVQTFQLHSELKFFTICLLSEKKPSHSHLIIDGLVNECQT